MYMRRIPPFREDDRFDHLLLRKAREGVKIYILLWKEPKVAMDHGSGTFQERLMNLHPNIKLMRHPHFKGAPTHPYSHHQKAMVVDYGTKHVKVNHTHTPHTHTHTTHTHTHTTRLS
jgi:phospholipase D1/2